MATWINSAEGGTNGTTVNSTGTNTGGASGTAFSAANAGITFSSSQAAHGSLSYAFAGTATTFNVLTFSAADGDTTGFSVRAYVYLTGYPSAETGFITVQTAAGASICGINLSTAGNLRTVQVSGSFVGASTNTLSLNTWYRIALWGTLSASTATIHTSHYALDSSSAIEANTYTNRNTGVTAAGKTLFGKLTQAPGMSTYYIDDVAHNFTIATEIGAISNVAPTVDAGSNQNVSAGAGVTLSASASDTDGTIASYTWSYVYPASGGPTLTGGTTASPNFTAGAAGSLYILQCLVTDNLGATASDTVEIRVPASGGFDPLAAYTPVTTGTWTNTGGGANIGVALSDGSDTTYVESNALSATEQEIRVRLDPATVRTTLSVTFRVAQDAAGTIVATGRLYEGTTLRQSWTLPTSTTATDQVCVLSGGTIAAITDWGNLWAAVAGTA